jgi:hypothetical protein
LNAQRFSGFSPQRAQRHRDGGRPRACQRALPDGTHRGGRKGPSQHPFDE